MGGGSGAGTMNVDTPEVRNEYKFSFLRMTSWFLSFHLSFLFPYLPPRLVLSRKGQNTKQMEME